MFETGNVLGEVYVSRNNTAPKTRKNKTNSASEIYVILAVYAARLVVFKYVSAQTVGHILNAQAVLTLKGNKNNGH